MRRWGGAKNFAHTGTQNFVPNRVFHGSIFFEVWKIDVKRLIVDFEEIARRKRERQAEEANARVTLSRLFSIVCCTSLSRINVPGSHPCHFADSDLSNFSDNN